MNGERIRSFRRAKDLTQRELAELLGVQPSAVAMWENGQAPSGPALKLLEYLIDGRHPFEGKTSSAASWGDVEFSLDEFEELTRRSIRAGFASVRDYMTHMARRSLKEPIPLPKSAKPSAKRA